MRFGAVSLAQATGAILAHSHPLKSGRLRKGIRLTEDDIRRLSESGYSSVTVARLDPGDMDENTAADVIARALAPDPEKAMLCRTEPFAGRANLLAMAPGVVMLDPAAILAANLVDPMITIATLAPFSRTYPGAMLATIKIISYAVCESQVAKVAAAVSCALKVQPVCLKNASLILSRTETSAKAETLIEKGIRATGNRLKALGMELHETVVCAHDEQNLARAINKASGELILILTATATSDICDVAPQALRHAGGRLIRFGIPVDPGNLLFLGELDERPVIGLPGCARTPALNGADWILERVVCGLPPDDKTIAAMGVGGLLKEIPSRPQPRGGKKRRETRKI